MALTVINAATVEKMLVGALTAAGVTVLSEHDADPAAPAAGDPPALRSWVRILPVKLTWHENQQRDGDTDTAQATIVLTIWSVIDEDGSMYDPSAAVQPVVACLRGLHRADAPSTHRISVEQLTLEPGQLADTERDLTVRIVTATGTASRTTGND